MIVVLRRGATEEEVAEVERAMEAEGLASLRILAGDHAALHVVRGETRRARRLMKLDQVEGLVPTSGPRVRRSGRRFYPYHFVQVGAVCVLLSGVLVVLAAFQPPGIGEPIDPQREPASIVDPWYARATVEFVGMFAPGLAWLGWVLFLSACALVLGLPVLDRPERASSPVRLLALAAVGILALAWAWLTFAGGSG